jgi:hypothetical protein
MFADTTGIEKNDIGILCVIDQFVATMAQAGYHQLAIEEIHLTADRFDIKTLCHSVTHGARYDFLRRAILP